ncbi:hypothetical protein FD46_GL000011 [Liquorilactobacillus oeni DSM 19972]|uniref:Uncharacterized protein n=1 Tax=Liquorilactobacillus oeni DSM 19972 TaxID=1423777 RepID=A0A0R1M7V3_9LACO|nr:hypothetical protein FD46_GL000011 [Liquorilactobacillus oeni DSM 19972]
MLWGAYQELTVPMFYNKINAEDFVGVQLTDKIVIPNVINNLQKYYPGILNSEKISQVNEIGDESSRKLELDPLPFLQNFLKR